MRRARRRQREPVPKRDQHFHSFSFRQLREVLVSRVYEHIACSVSNRYRGGIDVVSSKSR
jgi:hypothetical protein